jgi:voltage-gated potassium channel
MQAARLFRLLRLVRLVAAAKLLRALVSPEGIRDAAVLALFVILGGGAAFAAVESPTADGATLDMWDGVWWAVTTVTTEGYGDISPTSDAGRAIAMLVMVVGIGFVALLTAAAADRFIRTRELEESAEHGEPMPEASPRERIRELRRLLDDLERDLPARGSG